MACKVWEGAAWDAKREHVAWKWHYKNEQAKIAVCLFPKSYLLLIILFQLMVLIANTKLDKLECKQTQESCTIKNMIRWANQNKIVSTNIFFEPLALKNC